jgi:hypothetical protein
VKGSPVDASLVTFEDVLHNGIVAAEELVVDAGYNVAVIDLLWYEQ